MSVHPSNSALFHRSLEKTYPTAVKGEGVHLITADGRKIIDGSSGAAVSCLGHGNQEVIEAVCTQARSLAFAHSSFFTSDPAEDLGRLILEKSNGAFKKVLFLTSGSEAVESALKVARQFHVYKGQTERVNFIGRTHSYHGNTLGALAAGNNPARRAVFGDILSPNFHHVSRCFYQKDGNGLTESQYEDRLIAELEAKFQELGPSTIAAVILEPLVGATTGSVPATKNYLARVSDLCKQYGVLTIFDEVMCGMGRTGTYHAWQAIGGVSPDLQTIGKGLGAGYQPLSAVLLADSVFSTFEQFSKGSKAYLSGHTFQGHSMACAGALTVQKIFFRDKLIPHCARMGLLLEARLQELLPVEWRNNAGCLRGLGLFRSVDFGAMAQAHGGAVAGEISRRCFDTGVAVYLCSPVVDAILICPPFIVTEGDVEKIAQTVANATQYVIESRRS
ncbi:aminotransferase class-III domain-containing protein [Sarocladium implicatum]|nr:aminotransferase class-III domain-containing protein [Sarocladium implicatum]